LNELFGSVAAVARVQVVVKCAVVEKTSAQGQAWGLLVLSEVEIGV
jgi:hypothetical protein